MTDEHNKIIAAIHKNIQLANDSITALEKYLNVKDYWELVAKLNKDFTLVKSLGNSKKANRLKKLTDINIAFTHLCEEIQRSIVTQDQNYKCFDSCLAHSPTVVDSMIQNIPFEELHLYMCHQSKLIGSIIAFCNTATINNVKIFNMFSDDVERKWQEINDLKLGLCFGLSSLFLACSFISDMQQDKTITAPQDDLVWFFRCAILLQIRRYNYSTEQKQDLTRFISLIIYLQNSTIVAGAFNHLLTAPEIPPDFKQSVNFVYLGFSGANHLKYTYTNLDEKFIDAMLRVPYCLYIQFVLHEHPNPGHAVSLHKNSSGALTFYDPSRAVKIVEIKDKKDFLLFKAKHLVTKKDTVSVTVGTSCPNVVIPQVKRVLDDSIAASVKRRRRINV